MAPSPTHRAPLSCAALPAHPPSCSHPAPSPLPRGVWAALCPSPQISPFASRWESALLLLMRMHLPRLLPPPRLLLSPDKESFRFTVGTQRTRSCKDAFFLFFFSFAIALQGAELLRPDYSAVVFTEGHLKFHSHSEFTVPGNSLVTRGNWGWKTEKWQNNYCLIL